MNIFKKMKKIINGINWKIIKNNLYFLLKNDIVQHENDLIYKIKDETIEECILEFDYYKNQIKSLNVLGAYDTIQMLTNYPRSFTRFGDGEIHIIQGKDQPFQKYDAKLAQKMIEVLSKKREDVYVGLNSAYFESPQIYAERNRRFYRINATVYRRFFTEYCDPSNIYLDASCFGAYYRYDDSFDYVAHYSRIKALFANRKIAIVSGEGVFEKLKFDIFEDAKEKIIVHGPRIHAFSEYENIINKIEQNVPKDYLICLILGQTATVLVSDLTDMGYMAWDVGHVAKDYDAYMHKTEKTQENMDKFWAPD